MPNHVWRGSSASSMRTSEEVFLVFLRNSVSSNIRISEGTFVMFLENLVSSDIRTCEALINLGMRINFGGFATSFRY